MKSFTTSAAGRKCLQYLVTVPIGRRGFASDPSPLLLKVINKPAAHSGHIRVISLNRPAARNALSVQLVDELTAQLRAIEAESRSRTISSAHADAQNDARSNTRVLIISSELDSCFCAGADLKERALFTPKETASFLVKLRSTFTYLARSSIPTISAVSSVALGGGLELALSTHMRVFATSASVGFPEVRLGIIPGAGGSHRLPALIGLPRAQDLILTGRRVSGREAYSLGLCDRLVEVSKSETGDTPDASSARQETLEEALKLAAEICEGAPLATLAALRAMSGWQDSGKTESLVYDDVVRTKDRDEALIAFREKRKPRFEGH